MKNLLMLICAFVLLYSCEFKDHAKEAVNKTGETVAKAGSEFADGISKGIEKTFSSEVELTKEIKENGLEIGKISIESADKGKDNILRVYMIYNKDIDQKISVKVFTHAGQEYGRVSQQVKGKKGEAGYVDFVFDERTNLDGKSRITME